MSLQNGKHYSNDEYGLIVIERLPNEQNGANFIGHEKNIKLKMDISCSEDLARDFMRHLYLSRENSTGFHPNIIKTNDHQYELRLQDPRQSPSPPHKRPYIWKDTRESGTTYKRLHRYMVCGAYLALTVFVWLTYSEYKKRQQMNFQQHEQRKMQSASYEAVLAEHSEALLNKLEQLTALPRMRTAFPEITTMHGIARFKRSPDVAGRARAAMEFIWRVKYIFDTWIERPGDFLVELRPRQEDIEHFFKVWRDTEIILARLEHAEKSSKIRGTESERHRKEFN